MVRRAAVQVSQEEARADESAAAAAGGTAGQPVGGSYFGYGVAEKGGVFALDKDVFWFAKQGKDRFRLNLLNPYPLLRQVRCHSMHKDCWSAPLAGRPC